MQYFLWYPLMIRSPLLAKQYFPRQRRRRSQIEKYVVMATTRPITMFFQPVKSSEIENEPVNGEEAEAEAMEFENGKLFYAFIPFREKC